jgi:hypothetical protein
MPLSIIIVEKSGSLKLLTVKDYKEDELYKKCGFKKSDNFLMQTEWNVKLQGQKYTISMYGKLDGKAGSENKYDFPPPIDSKLFFGSCVLVGYIRDDTNNRSLINLTLELWEKIYEKLFGGFEDLKMTNYEDEDEEDELENIPSHKKTKTGGYLKDDFVVDSSETDDEEYDSSDEANSNEVSEYETCDEDDNNINVTNNKEECSELSEEAYEYSDDDN